MDQRDSNSQNSGQSSQTNGAGRNDEQAGERRAADADIETLEYYKTFLARLLTVVSHGQPETVERLFQTIRSGATQEQIFEMLAELRATEAL
ncbi:uncharacterized protein DSM5745_07359 [Aspergillus mulundensis]|uniref:Uncharacterized protein n=1 Tax=Aspergillus mulundensis TaxID=1810919 RepID=A0A3D8RKX2_9EURO|nr:hypothetical protein DSM5745_07359 [Aspergillus mulundensis]RDW74697.1 hypothetical protein DSM5745_07359 [Aspergillus mulundensis]